MTIQTKIVKFGNSKGVRLPKVLLAQSQLGEEIDMAAEPGKIIITIRKPDEPSSFKDFAAMKNDFDDQDWKW